MVNPFFAQRHTFMARFCAVSALSWGLLASTAACAATDFTSDKVYAEGPAMGQPLGSTTGTVVGERVSQLRLDVMNLNSAVMGLQQEYLGQRGSSAASAVQYHSITGAINARLQQGTTPGNPVLLRQWDEAQNALDQVNTTISRFNTMLTNVSANASLSRYLSESIRAAFALSGAIEEDHDQLNELRDQVAQTIVVIERLRNDLSDDLVRMTSYAASERSNLQALSFAINKGQIYGASLVNRPLFGDQMVNAPMTRNDGMMAPPAQMGRAMEQQPMAAPAPLVSPAPMAPMTGASAGVTSSAFAALPTPPVDAMVQGKPVQGNMLVLIRFNQANVPYENQLIEAVGKALDQKPNAQLTVVAVTPTVGDPAEIAVASEEAQRRADDVRRTLMQMGMPAQNIESGALASAQAAFPEVQVYIR